VSPPDPPPAGPLLEVRDLRVTLHSAPDLGRRPVLHGVSFALARGSCLSLVGESGCGKTLTALAVMGLLPRETMRVEKGRILFERKDLLSMEPGGMRSIRGRCIAMIFQDPHSAMNPYLRVSEQLTEGYRLHAGASRKDALRRAIALLEEVGIPDAGIRIHHYPHQFSGGMLQRIVIAMALMTSPELIIADEPTSALDVTIQAQTLALFDGLRKSSRSAVMLITHDLGVVADRSDYTAVMYAGRIVEYGSTPGVLRSPAHPYMKALLLSHPSRSLGAGARLKVIPGQPPAPGETVPGCAFAPRCPSVLARCARETPPWIEFEKGRWAACWLVK